MKLDGRIVVDEIKKSFRAEDERGHHLTAVNCLAYAIDGAGLDEWNDSIGEHLRMDAQMAVISQKRPDRIRNTADAHLQSRPIFNEAGDVLSYFHLNWRYRTWRQFEERRTALHEHIDVVDVNERIAMDAGHLRIDLCNNHA